MTSSPASPFAAWTDYFTRNRVRQDRIESTIDWAAACTLRPSGCSAPPSPAPTWWNRRPEPPSSLRRTAGDPRHYRRPVPITHHRSEVAGLDPVLLYRLLELRVAVFIVEQRAAYPDLDGRDVEPGAELLWSEEDGAVLATARVLRDPEAMRIGRVATAPAARSRGVASALMQRSVERCTEIAPGLPILLDAQEHLAGWYARFGFAVDGERFFEDGIPHVPMRRLPS